MDFGYVDLETYSKYDLMKVGADVYSRNCEIILASFALNDEEVTVWEIGQNKAELKEFLERPDRLIAHNAWFEFNVLKNTKMSSRPIDDWHCTMAQAYAHALPASLEGLGRAMGLPQEQMKIAGGKRLIRLFCKPQRKGNRLRKADLPEEWESFREYAGQDTATMRECYLRMPRNNLNASSGI